MNIRGIWIWENDHPEKDEYADFLSEFNYAGGTCTLRISVDSDYAAYLNGTLCSFGQYADYPYYKVADEIDLTPFVRSGKNELMIIAWFNGAESCLTYHPGTAGVIYEVDGDGEVLTASSTDTLCRMNAHYISHRCKEITKQLSYGYAYDANGTELPLHKAVASAGHTTDLHKRPIASIELGEPVKETLLKAENGTHFLLDLGREDVGFLYLSLTSEKAQTITVAYGEHIIDGGVRRIIGNRDFSVEFTAAPGENEFLNTYRRFGLRYLELFCEAPITLHRATIRPTLYPVTELPFDAGNPTRQAIYDTCVRTLRLCMHEHYEDCPWREQGLYAMDSRNQMLTGYDTFGETRFARAALALIAQDRRPDGLLSIAYPGGWDQPIPSFSLHYFTEVREYTEFSGDTTLAAENWDKLCDVLNTFLRRVKNGLIDTFTGPKDWNFYEWAPGLEGRYKSTEETHCDVVLNALLILAIESMKTLSSMTGKPLAFDADETLAEMRSAAEAAFGADSFIPAYPNAVGEDGYSELGNGLAVMAGIMPADRARAVFDAIADGTSTLTPITLSMKCFLYDAMLAFDKEAYAPYILADIDKTYGAMLDAGATSFWETEKGAEDFGGAGSLCHGWSAMPAYYYHRLLK